MPIPVVCPGCQARLNAPDAAAGKKLKCPKCQGVVAVPEPAPMADFEVVEDEPTPPKKPAPAPAPVKPTVNVPAAVVEDDEEDARPAKKKPVKAAVEDDEDEDERPRKKKRADDDDTPKKKKKRRSSEEDEERGGVSAARNIIGVVVLLVLLGVAGAVYYVKFGGDDTKSANNTPPQGENPPDTKGPPNPNPGQPGVIPASWEEYRSEEDRFRMMMPKPVRKETTPKNYRVYRAGEGQTLVIIYAQSLPPRIPREEVQKLLAGLASVMTTDKATVESKREQVQFCGQTVEQLTIDLDFKQNGDKNKRRLIGRCLITDSRVYFVVAGSEQGASGLANASSIFNTFQVDNPGSGPGPKPGGPADKYDRSKATKAALLHGEWLVMWEGSISAMKNMTDAKSVAHWCQNIEKNVVEVQRITKDFKAIGRFPPDAWPAGAVDVNGWKRLDAEYPVEVKAAEKRVEALGMPELTESLRKALAKVDEANKAFLDAFNAVAPNQPKDKGN